MSHLDSQNSEFTKNFLSEFEVKISFSFIRILIIILFFYYPFVIWFHNLEVLVKFKRIIFRTHIVYQRWTKLYLSFMNV